MDINKIKIDNYIFFKDFFNNSILASIVKKKQLLHLRYKEKDLGF